MQSDAEGSAARPKHAAEVQIGGSPRPKFQDSAQGTTCRVSGFAVARLSLGVLLLGAACLKAYSLILSAEQAISGRWLQIALVDFELLLAFWLFWGGYARLLWLSAVATFFVFFEIALYRGLSGEESCGCLGHFTVSPWAMLVVDALALGSLLVCRPAIQNASRGTWFFPANQRTSAWRFFVVCCSATAVLLAAAIFYRPASLGADGVIDGDGQLVMLQPKEWSGKPFPLIPHIDIGQELTKGRWFVLLRRSGCPQCEEMAATFFEHARQWANDPERPRFALIQIPPFGASQQGAANKKLLCATGKLTETKTWIVSTPVALFLEDGVVQEPRNPGYQALLVFGSRQHPGTADAIDAGEAGLLSYAEIRQNELLRETACGPLSLIAVLESLDVKVTAEEKERLIATAGNTGTTLLRLKEEAEHLGLHAIGLELPPGSLRRWNLPAIAHINGVGFAAVTGYSRQGFTVVFPLQRESTVSDARFAKMFGDTGHALLVSKSAGPLDLVRSAYSAPIPDRRGPKLRLSQSLLAVGLIHAPAWTATVEIHNDGNEPLSLSNITPSCTCMSAKLTLAEIEAKGSARLMVTGRQANLGVFTYYVAIQSNDSRVPILKIPVRGYLQRPASFAKPFVTMGPVLTNRSVTIDVPVVLSERFAIEDVRATISGAGFLSASAAVNQDGSPIVRLVWHGTETPGWYRQSVVLSTPIAEEQLENNAMPFNVSVVVVPRIQSIPPRLLLDDAELGHAWHRRVTVQINDPRWNYDHVDPKFQWSDASFAEAIQVASTSKGVKNLAFSLTPRTPRIGVSLAGKSAVLKIEWAKTAACQVRLFVGRNSFASTEL